MEEPQIAPMGALAARAHSLLSSGGHPLTAEALLEHVLGIAIRKPGAGGDALRGQLARVLSNGEVFTQHPDGTWGLVEWGTRDVSLDEMEYVVVDCETTGLNPSIQRVLEIAAIRCRGALVLDRFSTLIDPERYIPLGIRQLTGITPELVKGAPKAPEALAEFLAFAGGSLLVGHNVRFDYNFLGAEALRHHNVRIVNPSLCTIRLARWLLPNLRRRSLDNLAQALDLNTHDRHRAMGDAEVTQQAFWLLVELAREQGVASQGSLQARVGPQGGSVKAVGGKGPGRLLLDPTLRRGLPERPGVYLMKDERGKVLYVGKAKNIKNRIASYYSQPLGYRRKFDELLEAVRDLEVRVVGSELEALILESRLIKEYSNLRVPREDQGRFLYNVQERNFRHYAFIKVDVQSPFPRVFAAFAVADDGARYFGPYRSKRAVEAVIDLMQRLFPIRTCVVKIAEDGSHRATRGPCFRSMVGRCMAPCHGGVTPEQYRQVVDEVLALLAGGQETMLARAEAAMHQHAENLDFRHAIEYRDALRRARQLLASQQLLTGAVERNNLVIVAPAVDAGGAELFGLRHGRLFEQCSIPAGDGPDAREERLWAFLLRLHAAAAAPPVIGQEEVDQIIIVGRWLARYGESQQVIQLPAEPDQHTVTALVRAVRTAHEQPLTGYPDEQWIEEDPGELLV